MLGTQGDKYIKFAVESVLSLGDYDYMKIITDHL